MAKKRGTQCAEIQILAFNGASDGFDVDAVTCPNQGGKSNTSIARAEATHESAAAGRNTELPTTAAYPNPAGNSVTLDLNNEEEFVLPEDGLLKIETFTNKGDKVGECINPINDDFSTTVSLDGFPSGILLLKITNAGILKTVKILKR
ncbi:T9SS type A sorting domain-containing protein [Chryseolinea lacunae]|uniref:T9SS type A sorting domain-containing protein n=1 Tax=Chryseolinea lacunae TaxID=2801331 RepID=A0ABS1KXX5_9BACT|nr:T9SS type A sorting domain-containing protein [Chryseolinea lacunae]MBL0744143.1 T9SS type A sorting domain-containing protein [Chryseolinea lacunae]